MSISKICAIGRFTNNMVLWDKNVDLREW